MKCEVAKEIGLWDKIEKLGWKSLTSRESGRLGGEIAKRKRKKKKNRKIGKPIKGLPIIILLFYNNIFAVCLLNHFTV